MSTIITDQFRTTAAIDFLNKYKFDFGSGTPTGNEPVAPPTATGGTAASNTLFFGLGMSTAWTTENSPTTITNSPANIETAWANMLVSSRVLYDDMQLVIPRYNWADGVAGGTVTFAPYDPAAVNAFQTASPFICCNTDDVYLHTPGSTNHYQIYELMSKISPAAVASVRPTGTTPNGGLGVDGGDGYFWEYLYTVGTYDIDNTVTTSWIPVPYLYTVATENSAESLARRLGSSNVMVRRTITEGTLNNNGALFGDIPVADCNSFRQVSLISNPMTVDGTARSTLMQGRAVRGANAAANTATNNIIQNTPATNDRLNAAVGGDIIYIENRRPIYRTAGQIEEIKLVLDF